MATHRPWCTVREGVRGVGVAECVPSWLAERMTRKDRTSATMKSQADSAPTMDIGRCSILPAHPLPFRGPPLPRCPLLPVQCPPLPCVSAASLPLPLLHHCSTAALSCLHDSVSDSAAAAFQVVALAAGNARKKRRLRRRVGVGGLSEGGVLRQAEAQPCSAELSRAEEEAAERMTNGR